VLATSGTAQVLRRNGVACEVVGKYSDGPGNCVERILAGDVDIVVNTPFGTPGNSGPRLDGYEIRTAAVTAGIPCITTVQGMAAAVQGVEALLRGQLEVRSLQDLHSSITRRWDAAAAAAGPHPATTAGMAGLEPALSSGTAGE
jgi:carbamoyl-phosphate synthase large subunit